MKSPSLLSSLSSTWQFSQPPGCRCLHIRLRFTELTGGAKKWPKKAWLATNTQCHVIQRFLNCNVCMHSSVSVMQHSVQKMYQSVGKMSIGSGDVAIWYYLFCIICAITACSAVSLFCARCWWELLIITDNVDAWSQACSLFHVPIWIIFHFHDSILLSSSVWAGGEKVPRVYQDSK